MKEFFQTYGDTLIAAILLMNLILTIMMYVKIDKDR